MQTPSLVFSSPPLPDTRDRSTSTKRLNVAIERLPRYYFQKRVNSSSRNHEEKVDGLHRSLKVDVIIHRFTQHGDWARNHGPKRNSYEMNGSSRSADRRLVVLFTFLLVSFYIRPRFHRPCTVTSRFLHATVSSFSSHFTRTVHEFTVRFENFDTYRKFVRIGSIEFV